MKIALLAPIAWRTPPRHYGPWERVCSLLTEGLVEAGLDVTLFATGDSLTAAKLEAVCAEPYEENTAFVPKAWECLHIAHLFEQAHKFDLIHNHFDFLPLSYSRFVSTPLVTTIHGFSSAGIVPVYKEYADRSAYVSISNADRSPQLSYIGTVYHGIDMSEFTFNSTVGEYLIFFGRMHPDKGPVDAINIAKKAGLKLILAGIIQDKDYFRQQIEPLIDGEQIIYEGSVGPERRTELLSRALALLHPIYFAEPFGLSVVESMACGTPVIAYNRGSMPELIVEGQTGFIVSGMEEAVERVKEVNKLDRHKSRQHVEQKFSQKRMVQDYIDIYHKIL